MHLGYGSNELLGVNNLEAQFINGAIEHLGTASAGCQLSENFVICIRTLAFRHSILLRSFFFFGMH